MLYTVAATATTGATLAEVIVQAIQRYPNRLAFASDAGTLSYTELGQRISQTAQYFDALGLKPGDVVAQLAGNRYEVFVTVAAAYLRGLRSVTLHALGSAEDHALVLQDAQAKVFIVDESFEQRGLQLAQRNLPILHWLSLGNIAGFTELDKQLSGFQPQVLEPYGDAEHIIRIAYTGGTTGRSKGVLLSNRALLTNCLLSLACLDWPEQTRYLCAAPISHGAGSLVIPTLMRGGTITLLPRFSTEAVLNAIEKYQCNVTWMVPTMLYALLDNPRTAQMDWQLFHSLIYSAAPIAPSRLQQALDVFGPVLIQSYGQTEAPNAILILNKEDHQALGPNQLTAAGRPYPGVKVALLDENNQVVPVGQVGEICVRGPLVMSGYLHLKEETEKVFKGGWLHTGDMAVQDRSGLFYIVDRKKDLIITGGFNVYPKEVEDILTAHEAVAAAAVVGIADNKWGEIVVAFVKCKAQTEMQANTLIALVKNKKGPVAAPKHILFVDVLPVTALGKIDKKALRVLGEKALRCF